MQSRIPALIALILLLNGCVLGYVREDDPVAIRLARVEDKLARIERLTQNDSLLQLAGQVQQLQQEVRELRGEVERLSHQIQSTQDRQRDLYLDVDRRLQALELGRAAAGAGSQPTGSGDREAYQAAFELLKQSRYQEAGDAYAAFLEKYPQSELADNAQYWLGEARYVSRDFKGAVDAFRKVIEQHQGSAKVPDAWLKLGYSYYELEQWSKAKEALNTVISRYPDHAASRLAQQRLEKMAGEGH